ncbi:tripartite tricarboxylate transporter substrate binding protein [Stappia sp. ES.058]|uniref:tripartite tricarboxylate transporter substrate binding protein n=1 Tax=Stappia sp. ES.058 TaxID=1881061 RepID=UPI00087AA2D3|nr:tripartite tricarboxylate transporter substrate binding protein [Stappia sp. ES.058]SDU33049.1 Tripartite-type tricarboxylate transporter, receptor component TctC [Stappia sp. ES.058]
MRTALTTALAVFGLAAASATALADFPDRPVTVIVPWSAGGGTDATGRIIATMLEERLGQPFNVVNRTGGGGIVGHTAIKDANPDGYTIGILTTELSMYEAVGSANLNATDYSLVGLYNSDPSAVFVKADSDFQTIADLAKAVKADPQAIQASGANFGGVNHLSWVSMVQGLGLDGAASSWVPAEGGAPALQLLASGAIDVAVVQFPEAQALMDAGEIRALATLGSAPNPKHPDVPPVTDALGIEFSIAGWRGVGGPAGMPEDITATLTSELGEIVASDAFRDQMGALNYGVVWAGGADFADYLERRGKAFGAAISAAGLGK